MGAETAGLVAGVDGCKNAWLCITRDLDTGTIDSQIYLSAKELFGQEPAPAVLAIDIPIGLPDAGRRACDEAARRELGSRRNSVFPAPIRPALAARSREEAAAITEAVDGRKVGAQAWAIFSKIREVDEALASLSGPLPCVREVHPEVCFWAWAGGTPMSYPKRDSAGHAERLALAEAHFGPNAYAGLRERWPRSQVADDDILDALAALWTAGRILGGEAKTLPAEPPRDSRGLPMEIVY